MTVREALASDAPRSIMSTDEVSAETGIPASTLRYWRNAGTGPRSWKIGRRVVYDRRDVISWLDEQRDATARGGEPTEQAG